MTDLERKFCPLDQVVQLDAEARIAGYASIFGERDRGGDVVVAGAYAESLRRLRQSGRQVKMLWQHDPLQPIGIWDEVVEDAVGLFVTGRILTDVERGRETLALTAAGAIDGLSIGYRTVRAIKDERGGRRLLEVDLWEVSIVTFPMLPDARLGAKFARPMAAGTMHAVADVVAAAQRQLARR